MRKYVSKTTSSLVLNLLFISVFSQNENTDYVSNSIEKSLSIISKSQNLPSSGHNFKTFDDSYLRAPNSYIYDLNLAEENNYGGLKIPVKKAFEIWESGEWFLNESLPENGILSAYVYWEDVNGLISKVEVENNGSAENSKILVLINPKKAKGNALISLHLGNNGNSEDAVVWSWHVWVTDDPSEGVSFGQGMETDLAGNIFEPQYMDRNLGAVHNHILGHNWHKTTGLLYEWGRKDPIPPFATKDFSFHEISGLVGYMRNREGTNYGNVLPEIMRPFDDISSNLKFSIQNPIAYLLNSDNGTWFSSQQYRIMDDPSTQVNESVAWDLWSDNMRGQNSNASSSNSQIRNDSRSYELKSPYDPCPNGWRIPSQLGRVTINNNHSPWGRKNSGANDDANLTYNSFLPNQSNPAILDAKVYQGLGFDFTEAHNANGNSRNLGIIPTSGYYVFYSNPNGNPSIVFHDRRAQSLLWTATYSLGGARHLKLISDPARTDLSEYGQNQIFVNQTTVSQEGLPIRCMRDPNLDLIGSFETEYIPTSKTYFTQGLYNPNSYIISDETELLIPVNKAFAAYENLFPDESRLLNNQLIGNVFWTDNPSLVQSVTIQGNSNDARENFIRVILNPQQKGNALISLHNESVQNPVYWSWHIWVPADEIKEITYVNQDTLPAQFNLINPTSTGNPPLTTTFMDRNLGALYDLPIEIINFPEESILQNEVKNSGGFHYQWGRKDPIPSFKKVGGDNYEIYKGISVDKNGIVSYQPLNAMSYQSQHAELYDDYKNYANVNPEDSKYLEIDKIINYSVQNPLTFLHKGTTSNSDWVSAELALAEYRWGKAQRKSVYDPCPQDWRIPDVMGAYENGKGSSPWFNGKKLGSNQGSPQLIGSHYGGQFFQYNDKAVGWFFNDSDYQIGHFPTTGIIGKFSPSEVGGINVSQAITGIWTASLTQQMKGFALAMSVGKVSDSNHRMISTGNISPANGLNVRCAKDERRYTADIGEDYFEMDVRDFSNSQHLNDTKFYPNPVESELFSSIDKNYGISIFDLTGRIVKKTIFNQKKADLSDLPEGIYIALITDPENQSVMTLKMVKN